MELRLDRRNIVVIGTSAGGVQTLRDLFGLLPHDLPAAVLVVQHTPPYAPSKLHEIIARTTGLHVSPAVDGSALQAGTVHVAVADRHLMVENGVIRLTRGPKESRARPSVDVLFRSAAAWFGDRVIGAVLTGALDDGTAGLWAIKDRGGLAFVQEPAEADFSSMPESAIQHVDVDFVGPVAALAGKIAASVSEEYEPAATIGGKWRMERENQISASGKGIENGVMDLGPVSKYTCPDCHGVLVQINEGSIVRFRCHTGHAFSMKTLIAGVNAAIDIGLWDTLRAVEERIMLLRHMAATAEGTGNLEEAGRCRTQADEAERRLNPIRELVLDPDFFGHDPNS
ncbi:chemotaxis protein CheB [Paraburkholderia sp. IW21]|uniref:chemotaxis protein CheB n=1 Tax=Paraburkholderia sp. IW21 TaxID=3242488 RepID=UPI0035204127